MPNPLEYDEESEEDLFGSDIEGDDLIVDTRIPIAKPELHKSKIDLPQDNVQTQSASSPTPPPPPRKLTPDERKMELLGMRASQEQPPSRGVPTLKALAMRVVMQNAPYIDDIGDLPYKQVAVFLDHLKREDLQAVEDNCEHILKDTDWLWELFLIQEHPLFYSKVREKKDGTPRTKGWRRKFAEAVQEAQERQERAMAHLAAKYKESEDSRNSRKIKVLDKFIAPPKGRRGGHSLSSARIGRSGPSALIPQKKLQTAAALNKARNDMQRARVALTHASGKFMPPKKPLPMIKPPRAASASASSSVPYSNPYLSASTSASSSTASRQSSYAASHVLNRRHSPPPQPRIPPRPKPKADVEPFYGSHPTGDSAAGRAARSALPSFLKSSSSKTPPRKTASPTPERFRIDDKAPKTRDIPKARVDNFVPEQPKGVKVDFFSRPGAAPPKLKRPAPTEALHQDGRPDKHARTEAPNADAGTSTPPSSRPHPRRPPPDASSFLLGKKQNRHAGPRFAKGP